MRVQISDEGISITNPCGFIEGISADNLLDSELHGRNPILANALKQIGLAERTDRGIGRIYEVLLLYGRLLPDYIQPPSMVKLFIPKGLANQAFAQMISEEQQRLEHSLSIYSLMVLTAPKQLHRAYARNLTKNIKQTRIKLKSP